MNDILGLEDFFFVTAIGFAVGVVLIAVTSYVRYLRFKKPKHRGKQRK